jgi:hypothetical protein
MAATVKVQITGMKEFVKAVKAVDPEHAKQLRKDLNRAADVIVTEARSRIPSVTGKAKGSVKAASTQKMARVTGGGNKAVYYGWLDFGGWGGRNKSVYRNFIREGRYIYAAYYEMRTEFFDGVELGLRIAAANAGLKVEG